MSIQCIADNFRAELARNQIPPRELADVIGMNRQQLSSYLSGSRVMRPWVAHNIGLGLNRMLGRYVFAVDPNLDYLDSDDFKKFVRLRVPGYRSPLDPLILPSEPEAPPKKFRRRRRASKI
jgi:transcriptional regulator with XRE-family HTH domain